MRVIAGGEAAVLDVALPGGNIVIVQHASRERPRQRAIEITRR